MTWFTWYHAITAHTAWSIGWVTEGWERRALLERALDMIAVAS